MAAEEAWKPRFRELVTEAENLCLRRRRSRVAWKIVYARGFLADPMHAAAAEDVLDFLRSPEQALEDAAEDVLDFLRSPEQALEDAAGELSEVVTLLERARELARRGGTGDEPDEPLPRILGILGMSMTHVQLEASRRARDARMLAIEAYHAMELCCDCLLMIRLSLHDPAQLHPGVDDDIEGKRVEGYQHLVTAKEKVGDCAAKLALALQDVDGAAN